MRLPVLKATKSLFICVHFTLDDFCVFMGRERLGGRWDDSVDAAFPACAEESGVLFVGARLWPHGGGIEDGYFNPMCWRDLLATLQAKDRMVSRIVPSIGIQRRPLMHHVQITPNRSHRSNEQPQRQDKTRM